MKKENTAISGKNRFDIKDCRATMKAVVTTGNGGYEKLDYRDVPIPEIVSFYRGDSAGKSPDYF